MDGRRILVLVPHPDDEVVGAAAAIGRARARGARVFGLYLTTGVPAAAVLWPWQRRGHAARVCLRLAEAGEVAARLGIEPAGFHDWPTRTLKDHLAAARASLCEAMTRLAIDTLWVPAWEGGHQDHDVANFLGATVVGSVTVWEFAEYTYAGGRVRSHAFPQAQGDERVLELTPPEQALKRRALDLYRSERGNLGHIAVERECFRPLAPYDYTQPPHAGRQFYQRFQWVPFRHPRIDFTRPDAVCRALAEFGGIDGGQA